MISALINGRSDDAAGRSRGAAGRCFARRPAAHGNQARLRRGRLRRLHGRCVDGAPVVSCLLPAKAVAGKTVTTVEGIGAGRSASRSARLHGARRLAMRVLHPRLHRRSGGLPRCLARGARRRRRRPARRSAAALSGHLCRCGAYDNILRAVADACAGRYDGDAERSPRVEARAKVTGAAVYTVDVRHEGQLEARDPALAARARSRRRARSRAGARRGRGRRGRLPPRRRPHARASSASRSPRSPRRSQERARRAGRDQGRLRDPAERHRAGGGAQSRRADPFPRGKGQKYNAGEGAGAPASWSGNLRGPVVGLLAQEKIGAPLDRRGARRARSAAVRGTFRTGVQQHTCLEPHAAVARFDGDELTVHVSTQAVTTSAPRSPSGSSSIRAKVRVIAEHVGGGFGSKATLGDETIVGGQARPGRQRAGPGGLRPARGTVGRGLSAGGRGQARAAADARRRAQGAVADAHSDAGVGHELDRRRARPAHLPGRSQGSRRLRRRQQPAAGLAVPRSRRSADGVRARAGDRRGGAAARTSIRSRCASAGTPTPNRQRLYDWAAGLEPWRRRRAPEPQTGRYRRGVGVAAGYWLYLWQPGLEGRAGDRERPPRRQRRQRRTSAPARRTVIADTVAREFGLDPHEIEVRHRRFEICRKGRPPAAAASRRRSCRRCFVAAGKLKAGIARKPGASRRPARTLRGGSSSPRRPISRSRPSAAKTTSRNGRWDHLAAEGRGDHRLGVRLDAAPFSRTLRSAPARRARYR